LSVQATRGFETSLEGFVSARKHQSSGGKPVVLVEVKAGKDLDAVDVLRLGRLHRP
jgi:hypothetical protein